MGTSGALRRRGRRAPAHRRRLSGERCGPVWVIGILAFTVGGLGTWRAISAPEETQTVWVATRPLIPGQELRRGALSPVRVQLGSSAHLYVRADGSIPKNRVLRTVGAGELVPRSALGQTSRSAPALVVIELAKGEESTARSGAAVQVWIAARKSEGQFERPRLAVSIAYVGRTISTRDKSHPAPTGLRVELFVPQSVAPEIMDARNSKDKITLVPRLAK